MVSFSLAKQTSHWLNTLQDMTHFLLVKVNTQMWKLKETPTGGKWSGSREGQVEPVSLGTCTKEFSPLIMCSVKFLMRGYSQDV